MAFLVLATADIVVQEKSRADTCTEVLQHQSEYECSFNPQALGEKMMLNYVGNTVGKPIHDSRNTDSDFRDFTKL